MQSESLQILLALETQWTVSLNDVEFLTLDSSEISLADSTIQFGRYSRKISRVEWLRPNVFRIHGHAKLRSPADAITFYPGSRLPSSADLRKKRRAFQVEMGRA